MTELRRLEARDLEALQAGMPSWNATVYRQRLDAQERDELVQFVAWRDGEPVGRGMVLFPGHGEYSVSAERERCAEIRDVGVAEPARRRGIATSLIDAMEQAARDHGMTRIGLTVAMAQDDEPARRLYRKLGYRFAHGPFITTTDLWDDEGLPIPVGAVMTYLVKEL